MTRALAFAMLLLAATPDAPAQSKQRLDPSALTNAATRQPMLAERVARLYAQAGRNVLAARSQRALPAAVHEFERGLKELMAAAPTPEIRENYRLLELLWTDYRRIVVRAATVEGAEQLVERNEEIVWIASKGARLVQEHARTRRSELVRNAGEVRLLSQRIARLHLFRGWGSRSGAFAAELKRAEASYRQVMDALLRAPESTPEILAELQLAENQYSFLAQAAGRLEAGRENRTELEAVVKTCDNILEVMERVARLLETSAISRSED